MDAGKGNAKDSKKPIFVTIAIWLLALMAMGGLMRGFMSHPYPSQPWTEHARGFVLFMLCAYCGRQIQKRNLMAVLTTFGACLLLISICYSFEAAVFFPGVPLALVAFPQCIRWLKANSRFSIVPPIVGAFMLSLVGVLGHIPSFSSDDISNRNPIFFFELGSEPYHELDASGCHRYIYWQNGGAVGPCDVHYNSDGKCCGVCLSYSCPGEKTVEDYNDYFFSQMKRECIEHFGNDASWSSEISDDGFETLTGAVRKNVTVQICPNPNDNFYGSVLMYDSELCKGVLDEKNTQTRSETSDGERTNDDD